MGSRDKVKIVAMDGSVIDYMPIRNVKMVEKRDKGDKVITLEC